ncbi:unnamed protein product [Lampetra planeri]
MRGSRWLLVRLVPLLLGVAAARGPSAWEPNGGAASATRPPGATAEPSPPRKQTPEQCRGYYDVMGQFDPPFVCHMPPYFICCGSCGFRYCCKEPSARLNQTQCVKNETPRLANDSTGPPDVVGPFGPTRDKTHMVVYSVCGIVAFMLLAGIFTDVGLYKPAGGLLPAQPPGEPGGHCRASTSRQASEASGKGGGRGDEDELAGAKSRMTKMHSHPGAWASPARERSLPRGEGDSVSRSGSQALHQQQHPHHPHDHEPPQHQQSQHQSQHEHHQPQHHQQQQHHHHTLQHHHTRGQQQQQGPGGPGVRGQLSQQDTWPGPLRYHSTLDRIPTSGSGRGRHHQRQQTTLRPSQTTLSKTEVTV